MFIYYRFALLSRNLFHLSEKIKYPQNVLKLNRILPGSGVLTAGCCFSRQSDEEELLDSEKCKHGRFSKVKNKRQTSHDSDFEQALISKDMKRSFESLHEKPVEDAVLENSAEVSDTQNKRIKIDDIRTSDKCISQKLLNVDLPAHASTEPPEEVLRDVDVPPEKIQKQRPNYFVAVKISDEQIHQNLRELQTHILEKDARLKRSLIELKTLHITLMVMYIGDTETHARAIKALENIHQEHDEDMSKNPVRLEFRGLGHFQNRVLYAKLLVDDSYRRLCLLAESVKKHFATASIFSTESREGFTPHLTVAKIDHKKKQNKFIKKINPALYKDFNDQYFGSQKVTSIQLLSMMDTKDEAGYYSGNEIFFTAFTPVARRDSLNKMLEIEEKKKEIKEMISTLMKEKLK